MKKAGLLALCVLICLTLIACAGAPSAQPPEQTPTPEPPQMSMLSGENSSARAAYGAALKTLLDNNILPDGTDYSSGYIGSISERESMASNQFSVYDVDGDGREELILLYTTTMVAGERGLVFDWDEATGELRKQLDEFPLLTFYESGTVQAGWSHNQGKGGAFWPYNLYVYDAEADSYRQVGSVDAWDRTVGSEAYPDEVDESGSGFVYYIYEDLETEWDKIDPVDEAEYREWLSPYVGDGAELPIPFVELTAEQIQMLQTPG